MRFYKNTHTFYAGIDLHATTLYRCIVVRHSPARIPVHNIGNIAGA